jgi:hypothetical protein
MWKQSGNLNDRWYELLRHWFDDDEQVSMTRRSNLLDKGMTTGESREQVSLSKATKSRASTA